MNESLHQAIISEIHRLMRNYDALPDEVKHEVLKFLKNPTMTTHFNFRILKKAHKLDSEIGSINYYVI